MGFFGTTERALERWTTNVWRLLFPPRGRQLEVVAILHRQCDDNALILGRQRVLAPNAYIVELLPEIHRQLAVGQRKSTRAASGEPGTPACRRTGLHVRRPCGRRPAPCSRRDASVPYS
ncbi:FhaA domain-containing protein [Streptomyces sp. CA-251247]|uniref:FhaA domain-containing protein n=1 Tax=Streptomyces sp. CA-251247 TaxID=3240062 RepID=UPI003D8A5C43